MSVITTERIDDIAKLIADESAVNGLVHWSIADEILGAMESYRDELERTRRNHLRNQLRRAELVAKTFAYAARQDPAHSTSTPRRLRRAARNRDRWRKVVAAIRAAIEQTGDHT